LTHKQEALKDAPTTTASCDKKAPERAVAADGRGHDAKPGEEAVWSVTYRLDLVPAPVLRCLEAQRQLQLFPFKHELAVDWRRREAGAGAPGALVIKVQVGQGNRLHADAVVGGLQKRWGSWMSWSSDEGLGKMPPALVAFLGSAKGRQWLADLQEGTMTMIKLHMARGGVHASVSICGEESYTRVAAGYMSNIDTKPLDREELRRAMMRVVAAEMES